MLNDEREPAFAKVNLGLFLGGRRSDGRHELVTLLESAQLCDDLTITPRPAGPDEVRCPGVSAPNLVSAALSGLRAAGWAAAPVRVSIEKRIPVAAGMGGGSADAAAMLRCAPRLHPVSGAELRTIAAALGADVPSQLDPGPCLGTGAGEIIAAAPDLEAHALLVVPQPFGLGTADVYREADRLELGRPAAELAELRTELERALAGSALGGLPLPGRLIINDLQPAALSLAPELGGVLELVRAAGADQAMVCGSGPTVIGVFWGSDGPGRADRAAARLRPRFPDVTATGVVGRGVPASAPNV